MSKLKHKSSRTRPASTSHLAHTTEEVRETIANTFTAFSTQADYFVLVRRSLERQSLHLYDAVTSQVIASHTPEGARISSVSWAQLHVDLSDEQNLEALDGSSATKKRKRRKSESLASKRIDSTVEVVAIGLSNGVTELFSPSHARVVRTFSDTKITTAVKCVQLVPTTPTGGSSSYSTAWISFEDGLIQTWNATRNVIGAKWMPATPFSSFAFKEDPMDGQFLAAGSTITLYSLQDRDTSPGVAMEPKEIHRFVGHTSPVVGLMWESSSQPRRFISSSSERFFSIWETTAPASPRQTGLLASVALEASVRHICADPNSDLDQQLVLALSSSGKAAIYSLPSQKLAPKSSLLPLSTISIINSSDSNHPEFASATFVPQKKGFLRVAVIVGGLKPVFQDKVSNETSHIIYLMRMAFDFQRFLDDSGHFVEELQLDGRSFPKLLAGAEEAPGVQLQRYKEDSTLSVHSGNQTGKNAEMADSAASQQARGVLDVDMAELSLGQRLAASESLNAEGGATEQGSRAERKSTGDAQMVPVSSLSRTLIQALHSADTRLLETCLAHSDQTVIKTTVQRLPPQLAVPLLTACIERLGRGNRGANMKGGGGGASAQRGTGLIGWVRAVLIIHSGHLMSIPDLVPRLSGLHTILTHRLALQDRLLSLSGRLDLVLSQTEMRSSSAPTRSTNTKEAQKSVNSNRNTVKPVMYVEGESSDELSKPADPGSRVLVEEEDDEGSIEDVELGGDYDGLEAQPGTDDDDDAEYGEEDEEEEEGEHDSEETDDSSNEDSDDSGNSAPHINGFVDDEAEEWSNEEEGESDDDEG